MEDMHPVAALEIFEKLPDPRQQGKILYPLKEIILVALCAAICGADSYVEIAHFGKTKINFLRKFLPFEHGTPSHDTFGAVFSNIDPKQFGSLFIEWIQSLQETIPALVAIDGKTVRRSKAGKIPAIHVVSAWASDQNLVMGQVKAREKSNEITAIPELLSMLALKGALVSIDAMGCQTEIAEQITAKKADYLLAVKKNQENLYDDIDLIFSAAESQTVPILTEEIKTDNKGHGRIETRIYTITSEINYLTVLEKWPSVKCLGKVQSIREVEGSKSEEIRYFISSRKLKIGEFATAVRSHWRIENSLHWVLDIVFRDDECRARIRHSAANFVTLKHITLNMLKKVDDKKSMRVRRKCSGWDDDYLLKVLALAPSP